MLANYCKYDSLSLSSREVIRAHVGWFGLKAIYF